MHFVTCILGLEARNPLTFLPTPLKFYFPSCSNLTVGSCKYHQVKKKPTVLDLNKVRGGKPFVHLSQFIFSEIYEKVHSSLSVLFFSSREQNECFSYINLRCLSKTVPLKSSGGSHNPNQFRQHLSPGWPLAFPMCSYHALFLLSLQIFVCSSEVIIIN